jgi:Transposase DDE domain
VKSAEKSGACIEPNGYDAGKKIKGKKRHILVDTLGLLLHAMIHPGDVQDRDGGILLRRCSGRIPSWKSSLQTAATKEQSSAVGLRMFCLASKLKLSDVRLTAKVLWCSHAVGSSNEPSPG